VVQAYIHGFLFDGIYELGTKTFLDYFPEYRGPDGMVIKKRSVVGKKCVTRPWDREGNFVAPD
jgi:phytochromobilin:ferredoxin oxidoreductase